MPNPTQTKIDKLRVAFQGDQPGLTTALLDLRNQGRATQRAETEGPMNASDHDIEPLDLARIEEALAELGYEPEDLHKQGASTL